MTSGENGCMTTQLQDMSKGQTVESTLIAYVLKFSDFSSAKCEMKVEIRLIFRLFVRSLIRPDVFLQLCSCYDESIASAARLLLEHSQKICRYVSEAGNREPWSYSDTLILILAVHMGYSHLFPMIFPGRTQYACESRLNHITQALQADGMFSDATQMFPSKFAIAHLDTFSVPPTCQKTNKTEKHMSMMRARKKSRKTVRFLHARNMRLRRTCVKLLSDVRELQASVTARASACEKRDEGPGSGSSLLDDLCRMASLKNSKQRRYPANVLKTAELLRLTSRRGYKLLRQILPVPSESCLRGHFSQDINETKSLISERERINEHIDKLIGDSFGNKDPITIGMDAFAFRTFHQKSTIKSPTAVCDEFSNGVVFMQIPLNAQVKVKVVHILVKSSGNLDDTCDEVYHAIVEKYHKLGVRCWFRATDGDRHVNKDHDEFFANHVLARRSDFNWLMTTLYRRLIDTDMTIPVSDPLHLAKNIRGKLLDHPVAVITDSVNGPVSATLLEEVLHLGPALTDKSGIGRMRDFYVTSIFRLENVSLLLRAKEYASAFLFLPYSCLFTLLYSANLSNHARLSLAHLAYVCFEKLFSEAEMLVKAGHAAYKSGTKVEAITIAEPVYFKRLLHTVLAFGIAIAFGPQHLRLEAIGTHLVENAIGIARSISNNTDYQRILSAFANSEMRKDLAGELDLLLYVSRRINDGGAKINTLDDSGVSWPENWYPRDIAQLLHESCKTGFSSQVTEELEQFLTEFVSFTDEIVIRQLHEPSPIANGPIMGRNICYANGAKQASQQ